MFIIKQTTPFFYSHKAIKRIEYSEGIFYAVLLFNAAFTNATNKGCGFTTVLLYSGWN